ncbi:MAG: hypothetical protein IJY71_02515, partial [Clostridia bacterium]|nr:hypothetical protein [Clostridia bacterium]
IELARSDNISSSSKARTYRVGEAHISTERKTRARIRGENPSILALSAFNMGWGLAHLRLSRQMRCSHFAGRVKFSAKDITLLRYAVFIVL